MLVNPSRTSVGGSSSERCLRFGGMNNLPSGAENLGLLNGVKATTSLWARLRSIEISDFAEDIFCLGG